MDTIIRPPEAPPDPPISTARRPRWPRRVALGIVLLVVAALVVGMLWAENVEPLQRGWFGWSTTHPRLAAALDLSTFSTEDGPSSINCFEANPGTIVRYRFSIRNGVPYRSASEASAQGPTIPARWPPGDGSGRSRTCGPRRPTAVSRCGNRSNRSGSRRRPRHRSRWRRRCGRGSGGGFLAIGGEEIHHSIFGIKRVDNFQTPVAVYFAADPAATCSIG